MDNNIIITVIISIIFFIIKFLEIRFIQKDKKPIKDILRDTIIVSISSIVGIFIVEQFYDNNSIGRTATDAFIGKPEF